MRNAGTGTRLDKLRRKLSAREGTPGYEKNCEAIRQEIARLEGVKPSIPEPPADIADDTAGRTFADGAAPTKPKTTSSDNFRVPSVEEMGAMTAQTDAADHRVSRRATRKIYRDAVTGEIVTRAYAAANPSTTVCETRPVASRSGKGSRAKSREVKS